MNRSNIEYFYYRRACVMCHATRRCIDGAGLSIQTLHDADARPLDGEGAYALTGRAQRVLAVRKGQLLRFDLEGVRPPTRRQLLEVMLAPSCNLRAPAVLTGGCLVIGFHEGALAEAFALTRARAGKDPAALLLPG